MLLAIWGSSENLGAEGPKSGASSYTDIDAMRANEHERILKHLIVEETQAVMCGKWIEAESGTSLNMPTSLHRDS